MRPLFLVPRVRAPNATLSQSDAVSLSQAFGGFCHFSVSRPSDLTHDICCTWDESLKRMENGELVEIGHLKTIKEDVNYLILLVRIEVFNRGATALLFVNSRNEARNIAKFLTQTLEADIEELPPFVPPSEERISRRTGLTTELRKVVSDVD
jgi:hypothetical protein